MELTCALLLRTARLLLHSTDFCTWKGSKRRNRADHVSASTKFSMAMRLEWRACSTNKAALTKRFQNGREKHLK
ncbi:uncharacterized protein ASCRUDRAFT_104559 [Ascoidea rubescens DSM 1968]|uniref:Secreted protein n=1 Tax=Ascoidea rubescens DSM 1968 TaxID=1344418 RepID=A0A1D2VRX9_9ASCO|nr:hypothetical protein ASCRUDRAFT_104559 [Ascoidea rubescens DSM 1968]ODV64338.1 hypothetical protein ASCRUDRAFT_104559 [Ascoidea rubescens DSM 1968]